MQQSALVVSLFLVGFITLLRSSSYPLLASETLLAGIVVLISGLIIGAALKFLPLKIRLIIYALLVGLLCNVLFRPYPDLPFLGRATDSAMPLIIALVFVAFLYAIKDSAEGLLTTAFSAMVVGAFFVKPLPDLWQLEGNFLAESESKKLPAYLHIVVDGNIGFEKIPSDLTEAETIKQGYIDSYTERGFDLYGNVYVDHPHTIPSFSEFLNLGVNPTARKKSNKGDLRSSRNNELLLENSLFNRLNAAGYTTTVARSSYLNLCDSTVVKCNVYPFSPLLDTIKYSDLNTASKVKLILNNIFSRSGVIAVVNRIAGSSIGQNLGLPTWPIQTCMSCISSATMLTRAKRELPAIKSGDALFLHLIHPHGPFQQYNEECSPIYPLVFKTARPREYFDSYMGQQKCAQQMLHEFIDEFMKTEVGKNATIIVHGDHGPRNNDLNVSKKKLNLDNFNVYLNDLSLAAHSTYFAIRAPILQESNDQGFYYKDLVALPAIFKQRTESVFNSF